MPYRKVDPRQLAQAVAGILNVGGLDAPKADVVAEYLVEGDMIGHSTHGVGLVEGYLDALARGEMNGSGEHEVLGDRGGCLTWDGRMLPGAWLVTAAIDEALGRIGRFGMVAIAIGRSHHTGALASYLRRATDRGLIAQISCSTASAARMAPFGGTSPVLTPNPIAIGLPTNGDPILIDLSASISTTTMTQQLAAAGQRYPGAWALKRSGEPTDDPREVAERGGTLMPLGGELKGYKGFALALMTDILGQGLAGFGRADRPGPMSLAVLVQLIDPAAFGGREAFLRQSTFTTDLCRSSPPAKAGGRIRLPGDSAAASRRAAQSAGVSVDGSVLDRLGARAAALGVDWPFANSRGDVVAHRAGAG